MNTSFAEEKHIKDIIKGFMSLFSLQDMQTISKWRMWKWDIFLSLSDTYF